MTASEAARHDLYNGLNELLGPERAETLMAALRPIPRAAYDTSDLVTKSDLMVFGAELRAEISELRSEVSRLAARVGALELAVAAFQEGQVAINLRLDRLFLALVGGLIVIVGAMAGVVFMP